MSVIPKTIISTALVTIGAIAATAFVLNKKGLLTYEIEKEESEPEPPCPKAKTAAKVAKKTPEKEKEA